MESPAAGALVELENVSLATPTGTILKRGLSFCLKPGELAIVTGPNGCGKSTLLKAIVGLLTPVAGKVKLNLPLGHIAFFPQLQNISVHLPLVLRDVLALGVTDLDESKVVSLGLLEKATLDLAWNTASGGERNRTLLTQLLLREPALLLLDEPLNHLDMESRTRMTEVISEFLLQKPNPGAVVLVSHEPAENFSDPRIKKFEIAFSRE